MLSRSCLLFPLVLGLSVCVAAQRRGSSLPGVSHGTDLDIHVVLPDERPLNDMQVRVQLLNAGGTPMGERYTQSNGEARFSHLMPGNYHVQVSGPGIETAESSPFEITSFEAEHLEYVPVKLAAAPPVGSTQGSISAQNLRIPEKARKELEKGNEAARQHDWPAAQKHFRKALDECPDYAAAYNNLGAVCMQVKDYACARGAWQKATELDPQSARVLFNLARLRLLEHQMLEVESLAQRGLALEPLNPEGLVLLANTELILGKFDQAVLYAQKVHTVPHNGFAVAHLIAGNALEAEHKFAEAAAEYRTAVQEEPQGVTSDRAQEALQRMHQPLIARQQ